MSIDISLFRSSSLSNCLVSKLPEVNKESDRQLVRVEDNVGCCPTETLESTFALQVFGKA